MRLDRMNSAVVRGGPTFGLAAFALLFAFAPSASANASIFTDSRICTTTACTALSLYGVVKGANSSLFTVDGSNTAWNLTDIAVGSGSDLTKSGAGNTATIIDFADAVVANSSCTGSNNYCGTGSFNVTPTNSNAARVNQAQTDLDTIITKLATYNTGSPGTFAATGTIDVETTPGALKIYRNTSNYTQSGAITLNCGTGVTCNANSLVLIILAGASNTINRNILLGGGLTADQVLFFIPTGTGTLTLSPAAAGVNVNANFISDATGAITVGANSGSNQIAIHGHIFADEGALTFRNRGGSQDDLGAVPEPGTWALMIGGLATFGVAAHRRRKGAAASNGK
jgi:PEP-CTERM motif